MELEELTPAQALNLLKAMLVDDLVHAELPRAKAREYIEGVIADQVSQLQLLALQEAKKNRRVTLANDAGLARAMEIVGGPAGPPLTG